MKKEFQYDEFVKSVRPDPKNVEPNVLLQGYAGQSNEPNHFRLYTDDALNNFIELPQEAIIYVVANSKEENPLGGCKLWVKANTVFTYGDPNHANRPKSTFLEGDIMENFQSTATQFNPTGFQPTPTGPTCFGRSPLTCFGRSPLTCFGRSPLICIGRSPLTCFGRSPITPTCFGRSPLTCFGRSPITPTCFGRSPLTCFGRSPITPTCIGRTPNTGCGLNYSTGPITTFDRATFVQAETLQVATAVGGNAGMPTPTEDVTPYTPTTPVVKGFLEATTRNTGFQEFNPYAGY